jgi:soluble lytic murein transglycosylase-like protein
MIGKIDPKAVMGLNTEPSSSSPISEESIYFQAILKEKLEGSKPLEMMVIHFLNWAIENALSGFESEKDDFSFTSALPANYPVRPSQMDHSPPQLTKPPLPEVSNRLENQQDYEPLVEEAGRNYGVDPSLIRAMIKVESGGNPLAISPAGAQGLMQLMPATAAELGVVDAFDPYQNIMGGTRYLRQLMDRYQGNSRLALAAYNWGMGNLEKRPHSMPQETKDYITKVESHYRSLPAPSSSI